VPISLPEEHYRSVLFPDALSPTAIRAIPSAPEWKVFALRLRTLGAAVITDTSAPMHMVHKNSATPEHPWVAADTGVRAGQAVRSTRFSASWAAAARSACHAGSLAGSRPSASAMRSNPS
jgi:hypothetical protein